MLDLKGGFQRALSVQAGQGHFFQALYRMIGQKMTGVTTSVLPFFSTYCPVYLTRQVKDVEFLLVTLVMETTARRIFVAFYAKLLACISSSKRGCENHHPNHHPNDDNQVLETYTRSMTAMEGSRKCWVEDI